MIPAEQAPTDKPVSANQVEQQCTYAQVISRSTSQKCRSSCTTALPKAHKPNDTQTLGQYPTPRATPDRAKSGPNDWYKSNELTPITPNRGATQSSWDSQTPETTVWNTHLPLDQAAEDDIWATDYCHNQARLVTIQIFKKMYSASTKLPHLTTGSRLSSNRIVQPLSEIAEAALKCAQKRELKFDSGIPKPNFTKDKGTLVQAAECYKNALSAGKLPNALNKRERAQLEVIIAWQHWKATISPSEDKHATTDLDIQSIADPAEHKNNLQRSSTKKTWSRSEYMEWAKRNLTDATAIKLAQTYCDHLENGTAPMSLFSRMGKQAPPGTSFKYFSLLPYELREQIWLLVLGEEKNDVRIIWQHEATNGCFTNNCFINANNQQRLLFVNHELRELALKHNYELAFGTKYSPAKTYFDFKRDRLFIHTTDCDELPQLVKYIHAKDAERIQTLAIPLRDLLKGDEHKIALALCKFKNVKKIHLVCGDGVEDVTFCRAGDPQLAKNIERFLYKTWYRRNDPLSYPRVRMQTMPAMVAQYLKIDNLTPSLW
jgi:hypothetical protein